MITKRLLASALIFIVFSSVIFSQKNDPEQKGNKKIINDSAIFEKAKKSIYDGNWVFEATKVSKGGLDMSSSYGYRVEYFIVIKGDSCHYKLDPRMYTVLLIDGVNSTGYRDGDCKSEIISTKEDKKGNIFQKLALTGSTLRADVDITLRRGGNIAVADIYLLRAKKSEIVRYTGRIIPLAESEYLKK